jgi:hypothetical protein
MQGWIFDCLDVQINNSNQELIEFLKRKISNGEFDKTKIERTSIKRSSGISSLCQLRFLHPQE